MEAEHSGNSALVSGPDSGNDALDSGASDEGSSRIGGWIFLPDCRFLPGRLADDGVVDGKCVCQQSGRRRLDAGSPVSWKREKYMGKDEKKEASVSALCRTRVAVDADGSWMKREVSASYTVEASFVMAITLFFIAALLNGVFEVHGRITGRFVLQEAMERCLYREENSLRGEGKTVQELESRAQQYLRGFFRCGDAILAIQTEGRELEGVVKSNTETVVSLPEHDPERALRLLTVLETAFQETVIQ